MMTAMRHLYSKRILQNIISKSLLALGLTTALAAEPATETTATEAKSSQRPNIIIMMLDDLGYSDLGCYGSEIQTPHIDKLAADGVKFNHFYNTAKCHSSRVSLLTGLYSDQAGDDKLTRGTTIASQLKGAGYQTLMVGKWHLTGDPTQFGFNKYFGHLSGATNFFKGDKSFRLNGKPWAEFGEDFYTTDANIKYAKQFLAEQFKADSEKSEKNADSQQPFFLYIAHNAPHYPLHVRKEDFDKYKGIYDKGWDVTRSNRYAKQLKMGLIPKQWQLPPRPKNVPTWENAKEKTWEAERMQAFAGMVDRVDQTTGDLIAFLKKHKKFENTLILICSDNGACPFDRTRGKNLRPWDPKSYWCYDTGWSHVGNTPFRLHKQNQHAGGISSPLIAHWPKGISAKNGSLISDTSHIVDFMPTCLDLARAKYSEKEPLAGRSLLPLLQNKKAKPHDFLFFRFRNNRALIQGDWKIVTHRDSRWELYNLKEDGTEMNDLAKKHPEKVKSMNALWLETAKTKGRLTGKDLKPVSDKNPPLLKKNGTLDKKVKK